MSVRVNLLPREAKAVSRGRTVTRLSVLGVLVVVAALSGLYALQWQATAQAEAERDDARGRVAQAQRELTELAEFRELRDRYEAREELLAAAMAGEVAWARILNDLSLAFPSDASLVSLAGSAEDPGEPAEGEIFPGARVGQITATGYSLERYAPGVQSVLIDFEGARGFFNTYLQTATANERGSAEVTDFNGTIDLDEDAYTGRYVDGLPPEVTE